MLGSLRFGIWTARSFLLCSQPSCGRKAVRCSWLAYLEGPSTQYLRSLVQKASPLLVLGARDLEYWVLGPSGLGSRQGDHGSMPGPHRYVKQQPFGLFLQVLAHFLHTFGAGRPLP